MILERMKLKLTLFAAVTALTFSLLMSLHVGTAAALYTDSDIDCGQPRPPVGPAQNHCMEDGINDGPVSAYKIDRDPNSNSCWSYLNQYKNSGTYSLRDIINGAPGVSAASYKDDTWLSERNYSKTSSPVPLKYGSTTENLQINAVTFLCGTLVWDDNGYSTTTNLPPPASPEAATVLGQGTRWVSATHANDRSPNAAGSTNLYPARTGANFNITSVTKDPATTGLPSGTSVVWSGSGTLTNLHVSRQSNTRYWFSTPEKNIALQTTNPNGFTQDIHLVLDMDYKYIASYLGGVDRCEGSSGQGGITVSTPESYGSCKTKTDKLILNLNVGPAPSHAPTGSFTPKCSIDKTHAYVDDAKFGDLDGSSTYKLTGTLTSTVFQTTKTVSATSGTLNTLTVPVPALNPTVTFTLKVPDVGPNSNKPDVVLTKSINCKIPPSPGGGCPSLADSHVTIPLPDKAPNNPAPSGSTGSPNASQEQDTPQGKTKETSINDISPGGSRDPPTYLSESYQSITVDYLPYINDYSYDNNQPSVTYDSYYDRTMWTSSSSPDGYTCPSGGSLSGSTCTVTSSYTYNPGQHCVISGFTCTWVNNPCNAGDSGAYPSCTHTTSSSYAATPYYNWHKGATTKNLTNSNTVTGQLMTPCYDRSFRVPSVSGDQTNLDDNENPSTVTGGGGTIHVDFDYDGSHTPAKGLRQPMQVNLGWRTAYAINGAVPLPGCVGPSGPVTVPGGFGPGAGTASVPPSSCGATVPPLQAGDTVCGHYEVSPTGDDMSVVYNPVSGSIVNGDVKPPGGNGQTASDDSCSHPVVNEPYARFYGNDVTAGGAFASGNNQCAGSSMNLGTISGYERGVGQQSAGAGSQMAALSLGQIQSFASAFLRTLAPTSPTGLSFANTTPGFGGNLGSTYRHCVPDYYATLPAANSPWLADYSTSGAYTYSGDLTLGSGTVLDGTNVAIYVNGNVYISGDLTYQTNGWKVTGNASNVPSLYIIATGSINIDPGVHTLDGVYVAQNNTIHTCAQGPGNSNLYDATELYDNCHTTLRVNGSFVARDIILDRTYSSLRHSQSGENPYGFGLHPCDVGGGALIDPKIDCSAEIFSSGLDTYLSSPSITPRGGPKTGKFDAITSLSPIL